MHGVVPPDSCACLISRARFAENSKISPRRHGGTEKPTQESSPARRAEKALHGFFSVPPCLRGQHPLVVDRHPSMGSFRRIAQTVIPDKRQDRADPGSLAALGTNPGSPLRSGRDDEKGLPWARSAGFAEPVIAAPLHGVNCPKRGKDRRALLFLSSDICRLAFDPPVHGVVCPKKGYDRNAAPKSDI